MINGYSAREGAADLKNPHSPDGDSTQAACGSRGGERSEGRRRTRRYDLVVMAASAGGVQALQAVLSALPADFPAPIAVIQHRSTKLPNLLARVLARRTPLAVKTAGPSEAMQPGTVYLAPPDLHLTVHRDGSFGLSDGRKIRHVRSSANPLFESAAEAFGGRVIAVVLTGGDRDATDGVQSVKAHGGTVIAQDEATSQCFGMPRSAIETGCVDWVLPLDKIAPTLVDLVEDSEPVTRDAH
jgi:two-component system chemotaxis response regulator CheB